MPRNVKWTRRRRWQLDRPAIHAVSCRPPEGQHDAVPGVPPGDPEGGGNALFRRTRRWIESRRENLPVAAACRLSRRRNLRGQARPGENFGSHFDNMPQLRRSSASQSLITAPFRPTARSEPGARRSRIRQREEHPVRRSSGSVITEASTRRPEHRACGAGGGFSRCGAPARPETTQLDRGGNSCGAGDVPQSQSEPTRRASAAAHAAANPVR